MREINFDGLIGPTHNYAGLSFGNLAATNNAGAEARPRERPLEVGDVLLRRAAREVEVGGEEVDLTGREFELLECLMENSGVVLTREPGGSPGAEEIRKLLVEGEPDRWAPLAETLLFVAARADHVARVIEPALASGRITDVDARHKSASTRVFGTKARSRASSAQEHVEGRRATARP